MPGQPRAFQEPQREKAVNQRRPFDTTLQGLAALYSQCFLAWLKGSNVVWQQEMNSVIVTQERRADFLIRYLDQEGEEQFLHIEIQNRINEDESFEQMPYRMTYYGLAARGRYGKMPQQILILIKDSAAARRVPSFFAEGRLRMDFDIVRLWEVDPEPLLQSGLVGLLPLVPLMRGESVEELLEACTESINEQVQSNQERSELIGIALLMATLRNKNISARDFLRRREMSNILLESPIFEELFGDRLEAAKHESRRQIVLEALEHKFGVLPEDLTQRITSIADTQRLKQLLYAAMDDSTLESFQKKLFADEI
jgi:hypothetical protein